MTARILLVSLFALALQAQGGPSADFSAILGRPTDRSATLNLLSSTDAEASVEWGRTRTKPVRLSAGKPVEVPLEPLPSEARTAYRVLLRTSADGVFRVVAEGSVQTQRRPGTGFTFALQGDSHPERRSRMFEAGLYARTLANAAQDRPDFYLMMGDDFSLERLIERSELSQDAVDKVYAHQRSFLGALGGSSAVFLVNGNHEQAARYLLDGTETNAAVLAARSRSRFFPLPAPDAFYSGDAEPVAPIGLLRDYYAWTWGDALFVVIDPYWHSPVPVDNRAGEGPRRGGKGNRDLWQLTLGEAQYRWFEKTLLGSRAAWKFVFAHHVNGTGRGGVEEAGLYEWGGRDRRGEDRFAEKRPGWARPIQALMAKAGVSIFFQGHDHLYARQELEGVVYQSVPNPADPTFTAFNREAYRSGEILPNSGHLRVRVAPDQVRVDYVRAFEPADEGEGRKNGQVAHGYTLRRK